MMGPSIRIAVLFAFAAPALAGCGNWSNEDLQFLIALPSRDALEARVPEKSGSTSSGLSQRKDGLSVGSASAMYEKTVVAGRAFNAHLFAVLELVEAVTRMPPTTREPDRRIWGPHEDRNDRRRVVRLVIDRRADAAGALFYTWSIDLQHRGEAEWFSVVEGEFLPTDDLTKGTGKLRFDAAGKREQGFANAGDDPNVRTIDFIYDTVASPRVVRMHGVFAGGELDTEFVENADGTAQLVFDVRADFVPGVFLEPERLRFTSRWVANGAGRTDAVGSEGDIPLPTFIGAECWDASFKTVWYEEIFDLDGSGLVDGAAGDRAACAVAE